MPTLSSLILCRVLRMLVSFYNKIINTYSDIGLTFHDMTSIQFFKEPYVYFYLYS